MTSRHGRRASSAGNSRTGADVEPRTRFHQRLRRELVVRRYAPGLMRLYLVAENAEITCTTGELDIVFAFACFALGRSMTMRLPVREYRRAPWGRNYRWTAAANANYIAALDKRGARA